MDDQKSYEGIDIETAFGDPDAMEKAAARVLALPVCPETGLHCELWQDSRCTRLIKECPAQGGESATG